MVTCSQIAQMGSDFMDSAFPARRTGKATGHLMQVFDKTYRRHGDVCVYFTAGRYYARIS